MGELTDLTLQAQRSIEAAVERGDYDFAYRRDLPVLVEEVISLLHRVERLENRLNAALSEWV
jgi:hypothetical protein